MAGRQVIAVALVALFVGLVLVVLFVGYCFGRWETEQHYEPLVDELEETIDALLPSGVRVIG
jgi:hypothetical protein